MFKKEQKKRNCIFDSNVYQSIPLNGFQVNNNKLSYYNIVNNGHEFNLYPPHGGILVEPSQGTAFLSSAGPASWYELERLQAELTYFKKEVVNPAVKKLHSTV